MNYTVRVMGQALFICLDTKDCQGVRLFLLFVSPVAEILLRRREGEKFYSPKDFDLQALCQSFGLDSACEALAMCLQKL